MTTAQGLRVAMLGGDRRHREAARWLAAAGMDVCSFGLPETGGTGIDGCESAAAALDGAHVVVAPVQGIDANGVVYTEPGVAPVELSGSDLRKLAPGALFFSGVAAPEWRERCEDAGVELIEYREWDEFALLNAVPTAEGAIALALTEMEVTLHGSTAIVLGFGRTAQPLAQRLQALGAGTVIAARSSADRARAFAAGHIAVPLTALPAVLPQANLVCNTVPALVLTEAELSCCRKDTFILDLASAPGGVDYQAAQRLGLNAKLAPGLPGRMAPVSAGGYVAELVAQFLSGRGLWPTAERGEEEDTCLSAAR